MSLQARAGLHSDPRAVYTVDPSEALLSPGHNLLATKLDPLLHGNQSPNDHDQSLIHDWETSFDAPLAQLDEAISRLAKELALAQERKAATEAAKHRFRPALSATRRIPPEIYHDIFEHVLVADERAFRDIFDMSRMPWPLTRVSRYWRASVLSSANKRRNAVEIMRCRDLRFSIYFEKGDAEASARILTLLMMHSSQWKDAFLYDIPQRLVSRLSAIRGRLPRLSTLALSFETFPWITIDAFESCPSLTRLELFGKQNLLDMVPIPTSRLRSLECTSIRCHVLAIISACPLLESLEAFPEVFAPGTCPMRLHRTISTLKTSEGELLRCLNLPELQNLTIDGEQQPDIESGLVLALGGVRDLVLVSKCSLSVLTLRDCNLVDIGALFKIDSLNELNIEFTALYKNDRGQSEYISDFINSLACYCMPALKRLSVYDYTSPRYLRWIDEDNFMHVARARKATLAIDIGFTSSMPENVIKLDGRHRIDLKRLKARKQLDISIREVQPKSERRYRSCFVYV
ncbi:hypothetical protein BDZ89DRAFT_1075570 [Hymenopellis radicata]|nr:hypothetical protein BDZ89DRAFT_1075570 [Hymenopellis radicata]